MLLHSKVVDKCTYLNDKCTYLVGNEAVCVQTLLLFTHYTFNSEQLNYKPVVELSYN